MRIPRQTAAATAGLALVLAGCDSAGQSDTESTERVPSDDGHFRTAIIDDPGNLDPHMVADVLTRWVNAFMYDSLIALDEDGEAIPYLAESWEVDVGSVTYTLVEGITCADGSALTASDVAENFAFVADPDNQSPQLGLWVQPGLEATADDDARTVTLTSAEPDPFLLQGSGLLHIACRAGLADRSLLQAGAVGTGLYALSEAAPGNRYELERRDEYAWGPDSAAASDPGVPAMVTLQVIASESTATNLLLAGDIDAVTVDGADRNRLHSAGLDAYEIRTLRGQLYFNQDASRPGADLEVRAALAQAADFEAVGTVLTDGQGTSPEGLGVHVRTCPADTVTGNVPAYEPAAAAAALDAAGWNVGDDGVRSRDGERLALSLLYFADNVEVASAAELLASQWEEIGAQTSLQPITDAQIEEVLFGSGDWDAGIIPVNVTFPAQLAGYVTGSPPPEGINFAHIDNEQYEAAFAQASTLPADQGCEYWEEAERALVSNLDIVPFVSAASEFFVDGVELRLLGGSPSPPTIRLYER